MWTCALAVKVTAEDGQISSYASLWLACSWVRGGQPGGGGATDFSMQVLLESLKLLRGAVEILELHHLRARARARAHIRDGSITTHSHLFLPRQGTFIHLASS